METAPSGDFSEASITGITSSISEDLAQRLRLVSRNNSQDITTLNFAAATAAEVDNSPGRSFLLCESRHGDLEGDIEHEEASSADGLVSKWRQKERLKTTAVALVVCLNIGVDPPDVIKISPCARLECWVDPLSMQAPKALDTIGKNLQAQYERWQPRAKYKMHLDPTTEDVKKLCMSCRRTAKNERVLFHYNGHGVPRPTSNGEIWVFNKSYTQYIPLSVYDLQSWVGTPAIYIFDCSVAGQIMFSFKQFMLQRQHEAENYVPGTPIDAAEAMKDCILLCACSENELLPQNPDLPADVFTSCLTTPIKVALRWFCSRSLLRHEGVTKELIDRIPGKQTDRKTPLGELNWIFTAITDTIAWNVLPRALFQKLFRQDLLVASLFRNFLLAERIMRAANCTPISYPRLPSMHQHPMWQAWDMAAEMCLLQLPDMLQGDGTKEYEPSPFFSEQLTAFELWLEHGSFDKKPPEQLPIVLQVLLSQVHRLRALVLLGRFLDMGSWAVDLALSVGIFPYVLKLLQTTAPDLRQTLVFIWTKILAWDANSQVQSDLIKDGGHLYFIKHLESQDASVGPESRAQAAFVLSAICKGHPKGQLLCAQSGLLQVCANQLPAALAAMSASEHADPAGARSMSLLVKWLILCMGQLCEDMSEITAMALRERVHDMLLKLLASDDPEIRASAVFALGALIQASDVGGSHAAEEGEGEAQSANLAEQERLVIERAIVCGLLEVVYDASPLVRGEVGRALSSAALGHSLLFQDAVHAHQRTSARILRSVPNPPGTEGSLTHGTPRSAPSTSGTSGGDPVWAPPDTAHSGVQSSSHGSQSATSPGVRLRDDSSYEPILHVGLDETNLGGVYASADAARVGGGLYHALVEALCTLATDAAPQVSKSGQHALKAANVELVTVGSPVAKTVTPPTSFPRQMGVSQSMAVSQASAGSAASASGMSSFLPKSWQSKSWRSFSQAPAKSLPSVASSSIGTPSPVASPTQTGTLGPPSVMRTSYILRRLPDGDIEATVRHGGEVRSLASANANRKRIAPSNVYILSSKQYRWPLLPPFAIEQPGPAWLTSCPPTKLQRRIQMRDAAIARCASVKASGVRLREQVLAVNMGAEQTSALFLEPFKPQLVAADGDGMIRVADYLHSSALNQFPAIAGESPSPCRVQSLFRINELYNELLMCCTADGVVSVWRNYSKAGQETLATAWQSVLVPSPGSRSSDAVFSFSAEHIGGTLFAAGGRESNKGSTIHAWDLHREYCVSQLTIPATDGSASPFKYLSASRHSPSLYAADDTGLVHIFDLRAGEVVGASQPFKGQKVVGLVAEPCGMEKLVLGYRNGTISFLDCRMLGSSVDASLVKNVEGHSKGNMTVLCAHDYAPLLASATSSQVVKLWNMDGEQVGVVRAHSSILGQPIGPITCLAFSPFSLQLASGGGDAICAVYTLDTALQTVRSSA